MAEKRLQSIVLATTSVSILPLVIAATAFAAEVSRAEYKKAVEPICKKNTQANERILAGVKQEVKSGKLKTAAAKFTKASVELKSTVVQLEKVTPPAADK